MSVTANDGLLDACPALALGLHCQQVLRWRCLPRPRAASFLCRGLRENMDLICSCLALLGGLSL